MQCKRWRTALGISHDVIQYWRFTCCEHCTAAVTEHSAGRLNRSERDSPGAVLAFGTFDIEAFRSSDQTVGDLANTFEMNSLLVKTLQ